VSMPQFMEPHLRQFWISVDERAEIRRKCIRPFEPTV
jgi:hypothetical protein